MFAGINSFPYLALPLFILAATSWPRGAFPSGWCAFFSTLVGRFSGGLAIVAIVVSLFFGAICGLGGGHLRGGGGAILIPVCCRRNIPRPFPRLLWPRPQYRG